MSKEIPLTRGFVAIVDDEDYEYLMQWNWYFDGVYAQRTAKGIKSRMHRVVLECALGKSIPSGCQVDHINGDRLNCTRGNLRTATNQQNQMNRRGTVGESSQFKGVSWHKQRNKWVAYINFSGKRYSLGLFFDEKEAALAYDTKAKELFGEFARLNFPDK